MTLVHRTRAPRRDPAGALVLFHGRGADEVDLAPLLDVLDPERRLLGATPRAPLSPPPGGWHWYVVREVGYPDPSTFLPTFARAGRLGAHRERVCDPGREPAGEMRVDRVG